MTAPVPWRVELSATAVRSLERLPEKIAVAVIEFITRTLPTDPYRMSKPLHAPLEGWRVARRGDYRVTLQILDDDHAILVVRIDHRADVYRPR